MVQTVVDGPGAPSLPIYPGQDLLPGLAFNVKWTPSFVNMPTDTSASGADIDLALAQYPLHDFELTYEFFHDWSSRSVRESQEFKTMMGFFLALGGTAGRFLFKNPDDCRVSKQPLSGLPGTAPFVRSFGANGYFGVEPVGCIDMNEQFTVYVTDSSGNTNTASSVGGDLSTPGFQTITADPDPGSVVSVDMSYYYYCKFDTNNVTFEKFMDRLWLTNSVKIHSCRPGA